MARCATKIRGSIPEGLRRLRVTTILISAYCASLVAGCCTSSDAPPRDRVGAMPYPGLFTLYGTADVNHLGRHRYSGWPRLFQDDEKERGIMYTARAGFLDLAHIRVIIDGSRYSIAQVRRAMTEKKTDLTLVGFDHSDVHLALHYPDDWEALSADERARFVDEASIRIGERVAYLMVVWHEVITWFGYGTFFLYSEDRSAFSYEDTMSHMVGLRVLDVAIRDKDRDFDDAVTDALLAELRSLGVVTPAQTTKAAMAVRGLWWQGEDPLKRHMDVGLDDGVVYPWLVTDLPFGPNLRPEPFYLPRLDNVMGRDLTTFFTMSITPNIPQTQRIREHLKGRPERVRMDRDLPVLLEVVRSQMRRQFGDAVFEPWPSGSKGGYFAGSAEVGKSPAMSPGGGGDPGAGTVTHPPAADP